MVFMKTDAFHASVLKTAMSLTIVHLYYSCIFKPIQPLACATALFNPPFQILQGLLFCVIICLTSRSIGEFVATKLSVSQPSRQPPGLCSSACNLALYIIILYNPVFTTPRNLCLFDRRQIQLNPQVVRDSHGMLRNHHRCACL